MRRIDLTLDEVDRLLPLVKRARPYFEKIGKKEDEGARMPAELSEALRETTHAIASAHGYENHRTGWEYDGRDVRVSVSVEIPDDSADIGKATPHL